MIIVGVDTGGTFTDLIYKDGEQWGVYKLLSTPHNPAEAVLDGLRAVCGERPKAVVHGSTVATNAILERKGVRTALVTNRGFEDVIEIGRQNRSRLYDLAYAKEPHIVPSSLRFGVKGRILCDGSEHEPFDEIQAREIADRIREAGVESVAVSFLFSFASPAHEKIMGQLLAERGLTPSLSHEILSEFREFERTSTTVINAYVSPKMRRYITYIIDRLGEDDSLRIMQSNGGSITAATAMSESVRTILSGPAGGAVGAFEIARLGGFGQIITFDMGGTSTDVSLMDGSLSLTTESKISGYPVKVPMIDIHTVGAGGGSIASIDAGGALTVGPESAGADPGPICYGKGEKITVTDANLYLGRLVPEHFLGGRMALQDDRLEPHFQDMAKKLAMGTTELAEGIIKIANTAMERAIRVISVERGFNPADFTLFSFGGAGGLHAADLARLLSIPRVLIPKNPGILSAIGMLMADVIKDYSVTVMLPGASASRETLQALFKPLEERGKTDLVHEGIGSDAVILERFLDMRYEGQSFEIIVPFEGDYTQGFHGLHERSYGYKNLEKPVEIVNLRLRARGAPEKPRFERAESVTATIPSEAQLAWRDVFFDSSPVKTAVLDRDRLLPGNRIQGPALLVEYSSTILVPPFASGEIDPWGNLILTIEG